jgi:hypothetical protein
MMDFDLEEFDNIFYEKYLSQELITAKKSNSINNFQPSRNRTIIDTKEVFGIINQMKQNPVYEYVIFPGDSFDRISRILLFHYEK